MQKELNEGYPRKMMHDVVRDWRKSRRDEGYEDTPGYTLVATKTVTDEDGFNTDYTWYKRESDGMNVFVFGDTDIYFPQDEYFDWEEEDDEAAKEWFDSYTGFDEEGEEERFSLGDYDLEEAKKPNDWIVDDPYGQDSGIITRDDLNEFADAVLEELNKNGADYELSYIYMTDWDILECGFSRDGYEMSTSVKIDMRKVARNPKGLMKYVSLIAIPIDVDYEKQSKEN